MQIKRLKSSPYAGNIDDVTFKIENDHIRPVPTVEYLGFTINKSLRFKNHIDKVCEKALTALMPNVTGPTENKKKGHVHGY